MQNWRRSSGPREATRLFGLYINSVASRVEWSSPAATCTEPFHGRLPGDGGRLRPMAEMAGAFDGELVRGHVQVMGIVGTGLAPTGEAMAQVTAALAVCEVQTSNADGDVAAVAAAFHGRGYGWWATCGSGSLLQTSRTIISGTLP
jgi:hypothetical protein